MSAAPPIHIEGDIEMRIPHGHVMARLGRALGRLPLPPAAAHVRFTNVNGSRGGDDIRCAVVVELPRQACLRVERLAATPRLAFDASYRRLVRQLERARERGQQARRHPKKYYAASRALGGA